MERLQLLNQTNHRSLHEPEVFADRRIRLPPRHTASKTEVHGNGVISCRRRGGRGAGRYVSLHRAAYCVVLISGPISLRDYSTVLSAMVEKHIAYACPTAI